MHPVGFFSRYVGSRPLSLTGQPLVPTALDGRDLAALY
jgi:hypothetical protein